jgi:hypothetical protein
MDNSDEIIPKHKLNRILELSADQLDEYQVYTGIDGRALKKNKSNTWFESLDPAYKDYIFQFPHGRPKRVSDNYKVVIQKKQFLNLPTYWQMNPNEIAEFINKYHLYLDNSNLYHSSHPELAKYQFVKTTIKVDNNNSIIRFDLIPRLSSEELYNWVLSLSESEQPVKLTSEQVSELKIWAGFNGWMLGTQQASNLRSTLSILNNFSFSFLSGSPDYTLLIKKIKNGGSRKRKNRTIRKSRK